MRIAAALVLATVALPSAAHAAPPASPPADPAVRRALEGLTADRLRAHMLALADDRMEGRGTGTRGYQMAADYVAKAFESAGLARAGTGGSWFQPVPFRRMERDPAEGGLTLIRGGKELPLTYEADFLLGNDPVHERASITAPVAFAGYGVTAPELTYDDYAHVDVKGKIVVLLSGGPPAFPSEQRAYYSSNLIKTRTAVARGAVGLVTVRTPGDEARAPWPRAVKPVEAPRHALAR